jgi:hypothetical protein
MDSAERKLIDLYNLLSQYQRSNDPKLESMIQVTRAEITKLLHQPPSGDVNILIDNEDNDDEECCTDDCPPGPAGPPGPPGPVGPPGSNSRSHCILINEDYTATEFDYYIGVNSEESVTVTLRDDLDFCIEYIVKVEMPPPIGNRKVIVKAEAPSLIDGEQTYIMTVPYESVRVFRRGGNWHVIH